MNRIFFFSMLCGALMMMGGCSNEFEPAALQGDGGNTIGLSVRQGKQTNTRAALVTTDVLKTMTDGFRLWGYETGGSTFIEHMENQKVTWDGTAWTYADPVTNPELMAQWPVGTADFVAYAGVAEADLTKKPSLADVARGSMHWLEYRVPSSAASQKDLLVAKKLATSKMENNGKVDLVFTHALSAIAVQATTAAAGQEVTVTGVSLINLFQSGILDITGPTWGGGGHPTGADELVLFPGSAVVTSDVTPVVLVEPTNPFIVMPQITSLGTETKYNANVNDIESAILTGDFYLIVRWTFREADGNTAVRTSICAVAAQGVTPITFEPNKIYTFNLKLDAYSKQVVFNAPDVVDWDKQTPQWVDMDPTQYMTVGKLQYYTGSIGSMDWYGATNTPAGTNEAGTVPPTTGAQNSTVLTGCAALPSHGMPRWRVATSAELVRDNNALNALGYWNASYRKINPSDWIYTANSATATNCNYWTREGTTGNYNKTSTSMLWICVRDIP